MKNKEDKGITLIALIITIIVLLILAAIVVRTLDGDNGIIAKTIKGKSDYEAGSENEEARLNNIGSVINSIEDEIANGGNNEVVNRDTESPVINISSITQYSVTFTSTDNVGVVAYTVDYGDAVPNTWTEIESATTFTQTVEDPTGDTWHTVNIDRWRGGYCVWVKDVMGNVSKKFIDHWVDYSQAFDPPGIDYLFCYDVMCSCGWIMVVEHQFGYPTELTCAVCLSSGTFDVCYNCNRFLCETCGDLGVIKVVN